MNKEQIEQLALEAYPTIYDDMLNDIIGGDRQCWIEGFNKALELFNNVSRLELINHIEISRFERGRIFVFKKDINNTHKLDFNFQDDFKTLKIITK